MQLLITKYITDSGIQFPKVECPIHIHKTDFNCIHYRKIARFKKLKAANIKRDFALKFEYLKRAIWRLKFLILILAQNCSKCSDS